MEEKLDMQSPNWVNKNSQFIAERFPNCVTETAEGIKVDFELLKQELSNDIIEGNKERYRLEWPGKREAIVTANLPTTKTLRPVRKDSVDFYNTENLYIEGDNLEVLKLLQESYLGKIKMIYIDPPYNTGKDFVYNDRFARDNKKEYLVEIGAINEEGHIINRDLYKQNTSQKYNHCLFRNFSLSSKTQSAEGFYPFLVEVSYDPARKCSSKPHLDYWEHATEPPSN